MVIWLFVLLSMSGTVQLGNAAENAVLEVSIYDETQEELNFNDSVIYSVNISHAVTSKGPASKIKLTISLPYYVTFKTASLENSNFAYNTELNVVEIQHNDNLEIGKNLTLKYNLTITDKKLSSGLHYIVTPVLLSHHHNTTNDVSDAVIYNVPIVIAGCSNPLGMTNGSIKYYQLSSTSAYFVSRPEQARYSKGGDAWCANIEDQNQYIEVELGYKSRITAISTKGRLTKESWVKAYNVEFSIDKKKWYMYSENGFPKKFNGNVDQETEQKNWLLNKIEANYIRIRPLEWESGLCLRFELFGCIVDRHKNCIDPLGMEDGRIPDVSLSDNVKVKPGEPPILVNNSRLNRNVTTYPYAWGPISRSDCTNGDCEWLKIDLGSLHQITKIAIQGSYKANFYVKTFRIRYSKNGESWDKVLEETGGEKTFTGPSDSEQATIPTLVQLQQKIIGRYIMIMPDDYKDAKVLRTELFGCVAEDNFQYQETPVEMSRRSFLCDGMSDDVFLCMYKKKSDESSCHVSSNGLQWKAIHSDIVSIISKEKNTSRIFGVNRAMQIVMSENLGTDWLSLSKHELSRQQNGRDLVNAVRFKDLLSNKLPPTSFRWQTSMGTEWGGEGLFKRHLNSEAWKMSALWNCCTK